MKFNPNSGKIYDSIFFFYEYYNEDIIKRDFYNKYDDHEFMMSCYSQIKENITPPEFLHPLFYCDKSSSTIISEFFAEEIDFSTDTIDSFCDKLLRSVDILYQRTLDRIFSDYQKDKAKAIYPSVAPAGYLEAINNLKMDAEFKLQVSLLIGNFSYAISAFTGLLKNTYSYVDLLHRKYQQEIDEEFGQIQSESNRKLYKLYEEEFQYGTEQYEDATVGISLLNQFVILIAGKEKEPINLLFGLKHEMSLDSARTFRTLTLTQFLVACGNEFRLKILYAISEAGEMTLSQLSKVLNTAPTTLLRHIEVLLDVRIIYIHRREGLQIFYKVNSQAFFYMTPHIENFMKTMSNIIEEKKENERKQ